MSAFQGQAKSGRGPLPEYDATSHRCPECSGEIRHLSDKPFSVLLSPNQPKWMCWDVNCRWKSWEDDPWPTLETKRRVESLIRRRARPSDEDIDFDYDGQGYGGVYHPW